MKQITSNSTEMLRIMSYYIIKPHVEIQGLMLNALFIAHTKENDYLVLGKQKENGISVDMVRFVDDGLLSISDATEFRKADIFLQEAGGFMNFLSILYAVLSESFDPFLR